MAYSLTLGAISFLLAVFLGSPLIHLLREKGIGKQIRIEGPSSHLTKTGTPTMGGLMIVIPVLVITGVLNIFNLVGRNFIGRSILVPMTTLLAFGVLGAIDDLSGLNRDQNGHGLNPRVKLLWQILFAALIALALLFGLDLHSVAIPTIREKIDIGLLYIPIAIFIIVAESNAVNLTDGLDGLAGNTAIVAFAVYGIVAYLQGQIYLVAFCFTIVGTLMAFLWFNAYPADLFMGDTGSLALGATLGVVALMTGQWLLLPVIGLVFVAEALSVVLQVGYFRWSGGKRLFKMAPLHHHFELIGWTETHVTQRFWLVSIMAAMLGIALALL